MMFKLGTVLLAMATMVGCAQEAQVEEEKGETDSALAGNATTDLGDLSVVGILFTEKGATGKSVCTGSVIAPRVILTAGHCTVNGEAGDVWVGVTPEKATESAKIAEFVPHPDYDPTTQANDIGIVVLATPLKTVRPLLVNRTPLEDLIDLDAPQPVVKMVGYGATARKGDESEGVGTKRVGFSKLAQLNDTEFFVQSANGATACGGDSGGPTFLRRPAGWLLIGTESRGDNECKVGTVKVRTDAVIDWIDDTIAQNK